MVQAKPVDRPIKLMKKVLLKRLKLLMASRKLCLSIGYDFGVLNNDANLSK